MNAPYSHFLIACIYEYSSTTVKLRYHLFVVEKIEYTSNSVNYDTFKTFSVKVVMTSNNGIVEIQTTAEEKPFNTEQFQKLLNLAKKSTKKIFKIQKNSLGLY